MDEGLAQLLDRTTVRAVGIDTRPAHDVIQHTVGLPAGDGLVERLAAATGTVDGLHVDGLRGRHRRGDVSHGRETHDPREEGQGEHPPDVHRYTPFQGSTSLVWTSGPGSSTRGLE